MKKTFYFFTALMFVAFSMTFMSCSDDDDNDNTPININSYIIGTWRSYKAVVYAEGETIKRNISKTGETSGMYMEFAFNQGGTGTAKLWEQDNSGISRWTEEKFNYTVNGASVNVIDSNGESLQFTYEEKQKNIYLRIVATIDFINTTAYIYFKK